MSAGQLAIRQPANLPAVNSGMPRHGPRFLTLQYFGYTIAVNGNESAELPLNFIAVPVAPCTSCWLWFSAHACKLPNSGHLVTSLASIPDWLRQTHTRLGSAGTVSVEREMSLAEAAMQLRLSWHTAWNRVLTGVLAGRKDERTGKWYVTKASVTRLQDSLHESRRTDVVR